MLNSLLNTSPTPQLGRSPSFLNPSQVAENEALFRSLLTRNDKPADTYRPAEDRLRLHQTRYAAGLANAETNLNFAAIAGDALDGVLASIDGLLAAVDAAEGGDAAAQATIDTLLADINAARGTSFAGRQVFGDGTPPRTEVVATDITDANGYLNPDAVELTAIGGYENDARVQGDRFVLRGNAATSVRLAEDFRVEADTFVEFKVQSVGNPERFGLALADGPTIGAGRLAAVGGTAVKAPLQKVGTEGGFDVYRVKASYLAGDGGTFDRIAFVQDDAADTAQLRVKDVRVVSQGEATVGQGTGLTREVYRGRIGSGTETLAFTDQDDDVHHFWGNGGPILLHYDDFSVRWSGKLQAEQTGTYRLQLTGDDGFRAWVNGDKQIDEWQVQPHISAQTVEFDLRRGDTIDVVFEYFENDQGARFEADLIDPNGNRVNLEDKGLFYALGDAPDVPPVTPVRLQGGEVRVVDEPNPGDLFNSGPDHTRGYSTPKLGTLDLHELGSAVAGTLHELATGGRLDVAGGDFAGMRDVLEAARAQVRLQKVGVDAFARSMRADVNVYGKASTVAEGLQARLDERREAVQQLAETRLKLKEDAGVLRQLIATDNPILGFRLLA